MLKEFEVTSRYNDSYAYEGTEPWDNSRWRVSDGYVGAKSPEEAIELAKQWIQDMAVQNGCETEISGDTVYEYRNGKYIGCYDMFEAKKV